MEVQVIDDLAVGVDRLVRGALGMHLSEPPPRQSRNRRCGRVKSNRNYTNSTIPCGGTVLKANYSSPDAEGPQLQHASSEWPPEDASKDYLRRQKAIITRPAEEGGRRKKE
jgi:hypothetical protein